MSATLDAEKSRTYFHGARLMKVLSQKFPVEVFYTSKLKQNYVETVVHTALQIHIYEGPWDILIFLTGQNEIDQAYNAIRNESSSTAAHDLPKLVDYPFYSSLTPSQQSAIF